MFMLLFMMSRSTSDADHAFGGGNASLGGGPVILTETAFEFPASAGQKESSPTLTIEVS